MTTDHVEDVQASEGDAHVEYDLCVSHSSEISAQYIVLNNEMINYKQDHATYYSLCSSGQLQTNNMVLEA